MLPVHTRRTVKAGAGKEWPDTPTVSVTAAGAAGPRTVSFTASGRTGPHSASPALRGSALSARVGSLSVAVRSVDMTHELAAGHRVRVGRAVAARRVDDRAGAARRRPTRARSADELGA